MTPYEQGYQSVAESGEYYNPYNMGDSDGAADDFARGWNTAQEDKRKREFPFQNEHGN